jgi:acyl carrier protein
MRAMERDEVMKLVRDHLSTELEIAPERIQPETRFREDLDADSLDLYELVMELEDRYGIRVSEEEAAEIETVGDAVDYVCAREARVLRSDGGGATP